MKALHSIYSHEDYRAYLTEALENQGRGARLKLAEFLNCQPSFISQVLSAKNELSMEHAHKANVFFNHGRDESLYFMQLLQLSKAGTFELQKFLREHIAALREQQLQVHKVVVTKELAHEDVMSYYGNWHYLAAHVLVSIDRFRDPVLLQQKLGVSDVEFREAIQFLTQTGLLKLEGGRLDVGESHIHLKKTSPYAQAASVQTRLKVLEKLKLGDPSAVNFSMHFTASRAVHAKLKQSVLDFIVQAKEMIQSEDPEELCTITLDLIKH